MAPPPRLCVFSTATSVVGAKWWSSGLIRGGDLGGGEHAAPSPMTPNCTPASAPRGARLVDQQCAPCATITSSPGRVCMRERDLVGHRAGRHEERRLLAEQRGHVLLQRVDRRDPRRRRRRRPRRVAIASRIAGVGRVTVSERRSTMHARTLARARFATCVSRSRRPVDETPRRPHGTAVADGVPHDAIPLDDLPHSDGGPPPEPVRDRLRQRRRRRRPRRRRPRSAARRRRRALRRPTATVRPRRWCAPIRSPTAARPMATAPPCRRRPARRSRCYAAATAPRCAAAAASTPTATPAGPTTGGHAPNCSDDGGI